MNKEWHIFRTSLFFFTRIPVGGHGEWNQEYVDKATSYLPVIGLLVGGFGGLVFMGSAYLFPQTVAIVLSMVATVLLTGAFHEDGFCDVCDGFGGGYTKEQRLMIMKDSRSGAYAVIGAILLLLLKFSALTSLPATLIPLILITGHTISRTTIIWFVSLYTYARDDNQSKSKPLAKSLPVSRIIISTIAGFLTLLLLPWQPAIAGLIISILTFVIWSRYVVKRLGGYSGDCLGATQQLVEVTFYLAVTAYYFNFNG
jgi:adenosylcobinamide-GDP ribazoletransferase